MKERMVKLFDDLPRYLGSGDPPVNKTLDPLTTGMVAILDTETTGFDPATCEVIELGYVVVTYDKATGKLDRVFGYKDYLAQPKEPLPEVIQLVTGLTDADLEGHTIPWDTVARDLEMVDFIVAHNAPFDRAFCEKYHPIFREKPWADTLSQIDWLRLAGTPSRNQEILALKAANFVYESHRALDDAKALAYLLSRPTISQPNRTFFHALLDAHQAPMFVVRARHTPFEMKEELKGRGYKWDPARRVWYITVTTQEAVDTESAWLRARMGDWYSPIVDTLAPRDRFREQVVR